MEFISNYNSPLGEITLASNDSRITGLWFKGQKYYELYLDKDHKTKETDVIKKSKEWLDLFFKGKNPGYQLPLSFSGTDFQKKVWEILCEIPYGETTTYGEIAHAMENQNGGKAVSAQAVGGAVGHNQISIIVPCHRVVGASGSLTGYAGGIDKKIKLLKLEKAWKDSFYTPKQRN